MATKSLDIAATLKEHNTAATAKCILFGLLAPGLWIISYWSVWFIALMLPALFAGKSLPGVAHIIAAIMMVLLLIDGYRNGRELFDLDHYRASGFSADIGFTGLGHVYGAAARPTTTAYVFAQVIMAAPRVTVLAIRHFRERVALDEGERRHAEQTARLLLEHGDWMAVKQLRAAPGIVEKLETMGVIWLKAEHGDMLARIDPGYCP